MHEENFENELKALRNQALDKLLSTQKQDYSNALEPFEVYSERMKNQWNAANDEYLVHVKHGYEIILEEIAKQIKN